MVLVVVVVQAVAWVAGGMKEEEEKEEEDEDAEDSMGASGALEPPRTGDPIFLPGDATLLLLPLLGATTGVAKDRSCSGGTLSSTLMSSRASFVSSAPRMGLAVGVLTRCARDREGVAAAEEVADGAAAGGREK